MICSIFLRNSHNCYCCKTSCEVIGCMHEWYKLFKEKNILIFLRFFLSSCNCFFAESQRPFKERCCCSPVGCRPEVKLVWRKKNRPFQTRLNIWLRSMKGRLLFLKSCFYLTYLRHRASVCGFNFCLTSSHNQICYRAKPFHTPGVFPGSLTN